MLLPRRVPSPPHQYPRAPWCICFMSVPCASGPWPMHLYWWHISVRLNPSWPSYLHNFIQFSCITLDHAKTKDIPQNTNKTPSFRFCQTHLLFTINRNIFKIQSTESYRRAMDDSSLRRPRYKLVNWSWKFIKESLCKCPFSLTLSWRIFLAKLRNQKIMYVRNS